MLRAEACGVGHRPLYIQVPASANKFLSMPVQRLQYDQLFYLIAARVQDRKSGACLPRSPMFLTKGDSRQSRLWRDLHPGKSWGPEVPRPAGFQFRLRRDWIPAHAGMTVGARSRLGGMTLQQGQAA